MMRMVDRTMKESPLPNDFTGMVARKVASEKDLEAAKRYLGRSYHGKREPKGFLSVEAAQEANIYVVTESGKIESAGYDGEMQWGIGGTVLTVARPREFAGESAGVPDPVFAKSMQGCFRMAKDRGRTLFVLHGSMFDHGFCGLVPSFYYCVATLPVEIARNVPVEAESSVVTNEEEQARGREAFLKGPYAAKITAYLGGGNTTLLRKTVKC